MTSAQAAAALGCTQSAASSAGRVLVQEGKARQAAHGAPFEALPLTAKEIATRKTWADAAAAAAQATPAPEPAKEKRSEPEEQPTRLDLARIAREAAALAPGDFGFVLWIDAKGSMAGRPPLSRWWRSRYALRGFYESLKRWGIFCVGRGGGKSSSLENATGADALFARRVVPPGQTWIWPFISTSAGQTGDAARRVDGLLSLLRAVDLPIVGEYDMSGKKITEGVLVSRSSPAHIDLLDARGNRIQLLSTAGTIGNVSGPNTIGVTIDEAAKLLDKAEHANPLQEIIASLIGTFRARPGIRAFCCSSAFDRSGTHFKMVNEGDTETNFVAHIGRDFLDLALHGFELVAQWEQHHKKDPRAAAQIRTHAASLTATSPLVPTWVANETTGHPEALPWDGGALATRREVEAIPEGSDKLEGLTRTMYWLREYGSLPLDRVGGFDVRAQFVGLAEMNAEIARRISGGAPRPAGPMPHPLARPGDPRYAGPRFSGPAMQRRYLF